MQLQKEFVSLAAYGDWGSCCLWAAQLHRQLNVLAGTRALYKRWQATKSKVFIPFIKVSIHMVWQKPLGLQVSVSPSAGRASPKDLLIQQTFASHATAFLHDLDRASGLSVTHFPTSKIEEIRALQSGVCLLPSQGGLPGEVPLMVPLTVPLSWFGAH